MAKKQKIDSFFELLCLNDSKELSKFMMDNGKGPKPFCPIMFVDKEEIEKEKENDGEKN